VRWVQSLLKRHAADPIADHRSEMLIIAGLKSFRETSRSIQSNRRPSYAQSRRILKAVPLQNYYEDRVLSDRPHPEPSSGAVSQRVY
jgi:hypothetical protein